MFCKRRDGHPAASFILTTYLLDGSPGEGARMTTAVLPASKPRWTQRFAEGLAEWVYLPLLLAPSLVLVLAAFGALVVHFDLKDAFADTVSATAICTICLLPAFLVLALANTMRQARTRRTQSMLDTSPSVEHDLNRDDAGFLGPLRASTEQIWRAAVGAAPQALQRFVRYAAIYAFFSSMFLLAAATVAAPSFLEGQVSPAQAYRIYFGYAVAAATGVTFLGDFARMLLRATAQDGTSRMFAAATRRLLITIIGTSALACALLGSADGSKLLEKGYGWFVVGLAMAILGERAWTAMTNHLAKLVGITPAAPPTATDLTLVEGLGQSDIERLGEEGIDCVHALANTTTAQLYLSTPYPFIRLLDWQDQAHLCVRVGARRFTTMREQLGIRGAVEMQRLCRKLLRSDPDVKREDLQRALGLASETETQLTLERFANDRTIAQLRVLSTSTLAR